MKKSTLSERFNSLLVQVEDVEKTKHYSRVNAYTQGDYIDNNMFLAWRLKAKNLLQLACGDTSEHYREFIEKENGSG